MQPEPLVIAWQGRQLRVRHDDPRLGVYTGTGQQIRAAIQLATDIEGLQLALTTALGREYSVRVADDGSVVGLWRRGPTARSSRAGEPRR
jgi:hypothetical protein